VETINPKTISRLPASRFPNRAEVYFCDNCGRDVTKNLHHDRAPLWQPLRPIWHVCQCGRKYLSGAAEWDDLTTWERKQRIRQLGIGFVLFALLMIPGTLAYFALTLGSATLLAVLAIALIPSIVVARLLWFTLLDVFEIIASIWRTRVSGRRAAEQSISPNSRPHNLRLSPIAAVIAVLIIATRWIPYDLRPASPVGASLSPQRSNAARQEILFAPAKPPLSLRAQAAVAGRAKPKAPSPAFRRVQVGPNEVDYIAEDVTIRHFTPTRATPRVQLAYEEVHVGADVTIRYFASKAAVVPPTRRVSLDRSLPLSK
jgi:hypothetical protein